MSDGQDPSSQGEGPASRPTSDLIGCLGTSMLMVALIVALGVLYWLVNEVLIPLAVSPLLALPTLVAILLIVAVLLALDWMERR